MPRLPVSPRPWLQQLNDAAVAGNLDQARALLDAQAADPSLGDPNTPWSEPYGTDPGRALHVAVLHQHAALVELLAADPRIDVNLTDGYDVSALQRAVASSMGTAEPARMIHALLKAGANPHVIDRQLQDLPWGTGRDLSLAAIAACWAQDLGAQTLGALHDHGLVPLAAEGARLLALATHDMVQRECATPSPGFLWLLDHGVSVGFRSATTGESLLDLAAALRTLCPEAFARLERAALTADAAGGPTDVPTAPSGGKPRPRL